MSKLFTVALQTLFFLTISIRVVEAADEKAILSQQTVSAQVDRPAPVVIVEYGYDYETGPERIKVFEGFTHPLYKQVKSEPLFFRWGFSSKKITNLFSERRTELLENAQKSGASIEGLAKLTASLDNYGHDLFDLEIHGQKIFKDFIGMGDFQDCRFEPESHKAQRAKVMPIPLRISDRVIDGDENMKAFENLLEKLISEGVRVVNFSIGFSDLQWPTFPDFVRKHPEVLFVVASGNIDEPLSAANTFPQLLYKNGYANLIFVGRVIRSRKPIQSEKYLIQGTYDFSRIHYYCDDTCIAQSPAAALLSKMLGMVQSDLMKGKSPAMKQPDGLEILKSFEEKMGSRTTALLATGPAGDSDVGKSESVFVYSCSTLRMLTGNTVK